MNDSTRPETKAPRRQQESSEDALGLVVIWCASAPEYTGAWMPVGATEGLWGRGPAQAADSHARLSMVRQRPGANLDLPAFPVPSVSRSQLVLRRASATEIAFRNVGRCPVRVNGNELAHGVVRRGDIVEVGTQVSFLCLERPIRFGGAPTSGHPFGEADPHGFVGESVEMWRLRKTLEFVGPRNGHVLVLGASGTGKELAAKAIHALSVRGGPLVSRNAATLPESLIDAELFGNAANYPNAGMRERKGLVGSAHQGTLFLDEIAELPQAPQTHLLRILDGGEYQRLGDPTARRADFRLIGATNRPETALREDLLARFEFVVRMPDLTQRREDIPLLVRSLLRSATGDDVAFQQRFVDERGEARVSPELLRHLVNYPPRTSVRGVRNLLWRAIAESPDDVLELPALGSGEGASDADADTDGVSLDAERIGTALNAHGGSIEKTWRALGLSSRFALMRLMKKHGIEVRRSPASRDKDD